MKQPYACDHKFMVSDCPACMEKKIIRLNLALTEEHSLVLKYHQQTVELQAKIDRLNTIITGCGFEVEEDDRGYYLSSKQHNIEYMLRK